MSKKYKYEVRIEGSGGEFIAGEVKKEFVEALEENGISIDDYAEGDREDEQFECIPEDIRPFDPGEWFEIRPFITHATLADSEAQIIINDDDGNEVYDSYEDGSDQMDCYDFGVEEKVKPFSIYDPDPEWIGKAVYTCQRDEDGSFFNATFELDEPFDKDNLRVLTINLNERGFIVGLAYYVDDERFIEIAGEFSGSDINGATHELMKL